MYDLEEIRRRHNQLPPIPEVLLPTVIDGYEWADSDGCFGILDAMFKEDEARRHREEAELSKIVHVF